MTNEVTVSELDQLLATYSEREKEKEELDERLTEKNKELATLLGRITAYLKDLNREEYDSPIAKIQIKNKWRVNLPTELDDKRQFLAYLKEHGLYEKMVAVNSNSLNALFMAEWEQAKEKGEGMTFSMPGISAPKLFETAVVKTKKGK
jgi:chromosome segregation ATPase